MPPKMCFKSECETEASLETLLGYFSGDIQLTGENEIHGGELSKAM